MHTRAAARIRPRTWALVATGALAGWTLLATATWLTLGWITS